MKKRLLALNLVLVLLLTLVPTVSFADGPVVLVPDENGNASAEYYVKEGSDLATELKFTPFQTGIYTISIQQPKVQPVTGESLALYRTGENAEVISLNSNETDYAPYAECVLETGVEYTFNIANKQIGKHSVSLWFRETVEYVEPIEINSTVFPDDAFKQFITQQIDKNHNSMLEADELACASTLNIYVGDVGEHYPISSLEGLERFVYTKILGIYQGYGYESSITELPILPQSVWSLSVNLGNFSNWPDLHVYTNLTALDCSCNQLTSLPALPDSILYLGCSNNELTTLPTLPESLENLRCNNNELTTLPALPNGLQTLDCNDNQLASLPILPDSVWYMNCSGNELTTLPTLPEGLKNLECNNNELTTLPALPNGLHELECNDNQLASLPILPDSIWHMNCSGNELTTLPTLPEGLENLECNDNELTTLPALPNGLHELECNDNQLASLPVLPDSIWYLNCSNNELTTLPTLPDGLWNLKCNDNQLTSLPELPDSLAWLVCSYNQLTSLPALPEHLDGLFFGGNPITVMPDLPNGLTNLGCDDLGLTSMPELPANLQLLCCSNNKLTSLSDLPATIELLYCSNNYLASIYLNPEAHYVLLDVSNNCLPSKDAVTGQDIVWDEMFFIFGTQRVAEVHTHTTKTVGYVAPTCTEDGYTGDEVCAVCGETVSTGETIAATGHSYGDDNTCDNCGHKQSVSEAIQTWISDTIQSIRSFFDKIFGRI